MITLEDHPGIHDAGIVGGPRTTPAQRLYLQRLDPVSQLDHPPRAGKQDRLEIGGDAECIHVDPHLVDEAGELLDLLRGVELGLVADQLVHPVATSGHLGDDLPEVEVVSHVMSTGGQTKT